MNNLVWLAPIGAALIAALGTYLGIARKASGRIATTEASSLWQEASNLREVYRLEIERLTSKIEAIETRISALESERYKLLEQIRILEKEKRELIARVEALEKNGRT